MDGQVRNTNERGFAFVRGEDGEDYFLHASQLVGITFQELRQHDTVSFQPADGPPGKGPIATNAVRVKQAHRFMDAGPRPSLLQVVAPQAPRPTMYAGGEGQHTVQRNTNG